MTLNVHHLHDEASRALAQMVAEAIGGRVIAEPTDNVEWSGVRIFDEDSQRWVTSLKWVRGTPRDLAQATYQLTKAAGISVRDEVYAPPGSVMKTAEEIGVQMKFVEARKRRGKRG